MTEQSKSRYSGALLPEFIRVRVEQAVEDAIHPKGMSTHNGMARVQAADVQRLLAVIDALGAVSEQGLRQVGQVHHAMANDGKCGPYFWTENIGALPDGTPIYVQSERPDS